MTRRVCLPIQNQTKSWQGHFIVRSSPIDLSSRTFGVRCDASMTISGIQPLLDRPVSNVVTIYRRSSRSGPDATDRAKGEALNRNLYDEFVQKHLEQRSACTCHLEHTSVVLIECSSNEDLSIYSKAKYLREVLDPYGKTDGLVVLYRGIDGLSTNSRGVQKLFGSLDLGTAVYMHQHGHGFVKQDFGVAARLSRDAGLSVNTGLEVAANKNE